MAQARYDQRVLTLIEVRGGEADWAEIEARFEDHGWPVRGHHPAGEGPTAGVLERDPLSRVYEVEVRLFGAARDCDRGAVRRVAKLVRAARLEAYVRRAEPLARDREMFTDWRAVSTLRRPYQRRTWWRLSLRSGRYDTGVRVTGDSARALRLARLGMPPGQERDIAVRALDGRWRDEARNWREEKARRRFTRVVSWSVTAVAASVFAAGREGFAWWFWLTATVAAACAALWSGAGLFRRKRARGVVAAAVLTAFLLLLSRGFLGEEVSWTRMQVLVTVGVGAVLLGLVLLVRQWTWGEWVAWAVPLVATLLVSTLLGAGSVLHALYADGLSLTADDLDVPAFWQALAAVKLVTLLSLVMAVPAYWGCARHLHHGYAAPGEGFSVSVYVFLLFAMFVGAATLTLDSVGEAVDRTTAAVKSRETPPSYFGVAPEWTCVEPVVPADRLSGEGPRLRPEQPYLSFGVASGTAVLWERETREPVKLRASQVRLVPAESARAQCGSDAR